MAGGRVVQELPLAWPRTQAILYHPFEECKESSYLILIRFHKGGYHPDEDLDSAPETRLKSSYPARS
jgi:hypothetical protein